MIFDARNIAFFSKSSGLNECCCNILRTSLTCKTAPIQAPIGCLASVICTDIFIPNPFQTTSNFFFQSLASFIFLTLAVGHIGISIRE
jgi:hypothetical protein